MTMTIESGCARTALIQTTLTIPRWAQLVGWLIGGGATVWLAKLVIAAILGGIDGPQ